MAWVKLDDHFAEHPKVVQAGPVAGFLFVAALCYANRHLTNGFIPAAQVTALLPRDGDQLRADFKTTLRGRIVVRNDPERDVGLPDSRLLEISAESCVGHKG